MRIVSWNCNMNWNSKNRDKYMTAIDKLQPDIAVLQEVSSPANSSPSEVWIGLNEIKRVGLPNDSRGVLLIVNKNYKIKCEGYSQDTVFGVPVTVASKAFNFQVLGVWNYPFGQTVADKDYMKTIEEIFNIYAEFIKRKPTIVVGDFNLTGRASREIELFKRLQEEFKLKSCYHSFNNIPFGAECKPHSYYRYKNNQQGSTIDYCWIPEHWDITDFRVGAFDDYVKKASPELPSLSDHCPLIIDIKITK